VIWVLLLALAQDDAARCVEKLVAMQEETGSRPDEGAERGRLRDPAPPSPVAGRDRPERVS